MVNGAAQGLTLPRPQNPRRCVRTKHTKALLGPQAGAPPVARVWHVFAAAPQVNCSSAITAAP